MINQLKKSKEDRDAFVASQISVGLPFQIRALRNSRGWNQKQLADAASMLQPRISAMERPGGGQLNLETLRRIASAFDVGLLVRFVPFTELVKFSQEFSPDTFTVPSFDQEAKGSQPPAVARARLQLVVNNPVAKVQLTAPPVASSVAATTSAAPATKTVAGFWPLKSTHTGR